MSVTDQVRMTADAAWQSLQAHNIVPTPRNFELMFTGYDEQNPKLRARLNALATSRTPLTPAVLDGLYQEFCAAGIDLEPLMDGSRELDAIASHLAAKMSGECGLIGDFRELLEDIRPRLEPSIGLRALAQAVTTLRTATTETGDRLKALEHLLTASVTRIADLKRALVKAEKEATRDPLTGLANRRYFDLMLSRAANAAVRDRSDVSVLMLDIDHFKRFNDTYGHAIGDNVLRLLARTLTEHVKGSDTAARYGGEEFAIILVGAPLQAAAVVGNEIRGLLERRPIVSRTTGTRLGVVTCSIGAAMYRHGETLSDLITRSDQALYEAKRTGRNRVVTEHAIAA